MHHAWLFLVSLKTYSSSLRAVFVQNAENVLTFCRHLDIIHHMRIEDIDPGIILDSIDQLIDEHADAKASRVYAEEGRKMTKALQMQAAERSGVKSSVAQERSAYASEEYKVIVDGLRAAVLKEERARWKLNTEMMKIEVWRSINADRRAATK